MHFFFVSENSICGFDYSNENPTTGSFLFFRTIISFLIPALVMTYALYILVTRGRLQMNTSTQANVTKYLIIVSPVILVVYTIQYISNIITGRGWTSSTFVTFFTLFESFCLGCGLFSAVLLKHVFSTFFIMYRARTTTALAINSTLRKRSSRVWVNQRGGSSPCETTSL